MAAKVLTQGADNNDPFRMYASPVGARFLKNANKIFEDFPTSRYLLFAVIFIIEATIAIGFGVYLIP